MKTGDFQTRVRHWSVQWEMERTLPPELRNIKNGKFILRVALGSLTRDLRKTLSLPILLLTAKGETANRIEGLEAGADDYLVKPFEPKELLLRVGAILRRVPQQRPAQPAPKVLQLGAVRYDMDRGELWRGAEPIRLTATEAALMRAFAAQPGVALSRDKLVGDAPADEGGQERAVDVQITRLRRKIEDDPKSPRYLQTVRGEGYMLQPD